MKSFLIILISLLTNLTGFGQVNKSHSDSTKHCINRVVIDYDTKRPLQEIHINTNGISVQTDSNGNFQLYLPDSLIGKKITLQFYHHYFGSKEVVI